MQCQFSDKLLLREITLAQAYPTVTVEYSIIQHAAAAAAAPGSKAVDSILYVLPQCSHGGTMAIGGEIMVALGLFEFSTLDIA